MKYKVSLNSKGRVDSIEEVGISTVSKTSPPKYLEPLISNGKVINCSGQTWDSFNSQQRSELLEMVELTGGDPQGYIRAMESMLPKNPRGK